MGSRNRAHVDAGIRKGEGWTGRGSQTNPLLGGEGYQGRGMERALEDHAEVRAGFTTGPPTHSPHALADRGAGLEKKRPVSGGCDHTHASELAEDSDWKEHGVTGLGRESSRI